MNLMQFIIGDKKAPKKSAQQLAADEALARYAKLVEAAGNPPKTWAEIAEQIRALPRSRSHESSAETIRAIRDEL